MNIEHDKALAALLCPLVTSFVDQVVPAGGQQNGSKLTPLLVDGLQEVMLQQRQEEPVGQLLGLLRRIATPPDVGVERIPVVLAELGQSPRACAESPACADVTSPQ